MSEEKILVVDDDPGLLKLMKARLEGAGYRPTLAATGDEAIALAQGEIFALAILDLKMEGLNGIQVMEELLRVQPFLPTIILTAYGSISDAVEATKKGAYDFLTKPFDAKDLLYRLQKALELGKLKEEVGRLRTLVKERFHFDSIITTSDKMQQILKQITQISVTDSTVCLYGESGTGKELMAKALHVSSGRARMPFVAVNCGAIPEGLLENELFGHVRGAFTGATQSKLGILQQADGGTLFLDEISELPLALQVKLLRVLQESEFCPLGAVRPSRVNIRYVAATNQDLGKAVKEGRFREDLYYRIHVIPIEIPPLRERPEDIPLLARHFFEQFKRDMNRDIQAISPEAMQRLMLHSWPGNVRELSNALERAVALASGATITPADLLLGREESSRPQAGVQPLSEARHEFERAYLAQILTASRGNISRAAEMAGRYRAEIYKLLRKHAMDPASFKNLE
ncbi:MAG: sigma-54 dependent transcriptional regulator [Syntrophobacteraceae bacterium]|jgi:two-component system response regulator GlrR|nr:sigma-54 dependent transcriptional regulator [Syntrophobacteraceae bacterium]